MTDVPRRSYPLVVPPPGGFEDAVRRGRRMRRRKAGGGTGAALALVGVITYSTFGGSGGTSGLQPTRPLPQGDATEAPGQGSASPEPTVSPTNTQPSATSSPQAGENPGQGGGRPTDLPTPDSVPTTRPPRGEGNPVVYAPRDSVHESAPGPSPTAQSECLPTSGTKWCATAFATPESTSMGTRYRLAYLLCRAVDSGDGVVTFTRRDEADFAATDDTNDDTVWTYSAGRAAIGASSTSTVPAGQCVEWYTYWDGYDDFGRTPPAGQYTLVARSVGTSDGPLPAKSVTFTHA